MRLNKKRVKLLKSTFERRTGVKWNTLLASSSEVVLFGSWAIEGETERSDIDLLCVDFPGRIRSTSVDVLRYPARFLFSEAWLTSELGVHIACYGIWLKGKGAWKTLAEITPTTLLKKKEQILVRVTRLTCSLTLPTISRAVRMRELVKLRRDIQRYASLARNQATPPAVLLDKHWANSESERQHCAALLHQFSASLSTQYKDLASKLVSLDSNTRA